MAGKKAQARLTPEEKLQQALVPEAEQPYKLPANWCWTYVKYVSEVVTGGTPSKKHTEYYGGNFPFFKPVDLNSGRHVYNASEYLSEAGKNISCMIPKYSTLVCCIGSIGKSGYLEIDGTTNQQINSAIPKFDSLYLYYFINTNYFIIQLLQKASATTISIVNKTKMENCFFPLPPLAEQQRIVERIESLFAKLDEAKENLQNVLDGFETRKAAILHKAFTGELTSNWRKQHGVSMDSWEEKRLGSCGSLQRGRSKHRPRNDSRLFGEKYPFIQTGDVANAEMYIINHSKMLSDFGLQQSKLFPKGTLCITIAANIGKVGILTYDCCFPDSVVGFLPNNENICEFIYYKLTTLQKELEELAPATAQKNINLKLLNDLKINMPILDEQTEIVRIIDDLLAKEQQAKELAENALAKIDLIKKSILARAFRGELGTNNPADEPAVELLKQVL